MEKNEENDEKDVENGEEKAGNELIKRNKERKNIKKEVGKNDFIKDSNF